MEISNDSEEHPSQDLEFYRERICQLYMTEKRSLPYVISQLRTEGCHASKNMYLKKLKAWGFEKYTRKRVSTRSADGSVNVPTNGSASSSTDQHHLEHRTQQSTMTGLSQGGEEAKGFIQFTLARPLHQPDILARPERLIHTIRTAQRLYYTILQTAPPGRLPERNNNFSRDVSFGAHMMAHGQTKGGAAIIERGLQNLESVLITGVHISIDKFIFILASMLHNGLNDLAEAFARYVYQFSLKIFDSNHILVSLTGSIYQNCSSSQALFQALTASYDMATEIFESSSFHLSQALARLVVCCEVCGSDDEVCQSYEKLLLVTNQLEDRRPGVQARFSFGRYLVENSRFQRGIALIQEVCNFLNDIVNTESEVDIFYLTLHSRTQVALGTYTMRQPEFERFEEDETSRQKRYNTSEPLLKSAVEKAIQYLGPKHAETILASEMLAEFYKMYGSPSELQSQVDFIDSQLEDFKLS